MEARPFLLEEKVSEEEYVHASRQERVKAKTKRSSELKTNEKQPSTRLDHPLILPSLLATRYLTQETQITLKQPSSDSSSSTSVVVGVVWGREEREGRDESRSATRRVERAIKRRETQEQER